jgi:tricorn protease
MRSLVAQMLAAVVIAPLTAQERGYYRFPAIHGDVIVFAAEGDLWRVDLNGGAASRLTTHPGDETNAAFSPDGRHIAFSGTYEGPTDVYLMPAAGGLPRRLTYEGGARVVGWTPDGRVLYSTTVHSTLPNAQLATLHPETGNRVALPLAQAADGWFDGSGGSLYFTRFAAQSSQTKRYRGGTAQDIWKFAAPGTEATPLTPDFPGTSRRPMWWNGRVYFESDRDGTMNLWSMAEDGRDLRQHTRHVGWDVRGPSLGSGRIVYQLGADLRVFDIQSGQDREVPITLASDFDQLRERWVERPLDYLTSWHLSPTGDRLVFTTRGKAFVAPVTQGRLVEATRQHGVRYRSARLLADGAALIVLSDQSGEVEWWTAPANGVGEARQLTRDATVLRFDGIPSPDGKWLAHWNQDQELWLTEMTTGQSRRIAFSEQWGFDPPVWSPDSRWFVYGEPAGNTFTQLFLFDVATGTSTAITSDRYNSESPAWSADGQWLYFLSDRNLQSLVGAPWGARQPEPFLDKQDKLYAIAMVDGAKFPFAERTEFTANGAQPAATTAEGGRPRPAAASASRQSEAPPLVVRVDLAGIPSRILEVPVPAGNHNGLSANDKRLFWIDRETSGERQASLMMLDIGNDSPKPKVLVEDIRGYELSPDGKKIGVRKGEAFYVIDASAAAPAKLDEARVNLADWRFPVDPREDWKQVLVDSWRLERDYFYDPGMHGVNWKGMLDKYLPLVDRVRTRGELHDLQAQMAGELSALHIFVRGGDVRDGPEDIQTATLGARLVRDERAGGYRVEHIYRADPDLPDQLSPLAQYGVGVKDGDVITAVNGVPALSAPDLGALLRNQSGKQVRITVGAAGGGPSRDAIVKPITAQRDADLRYDEWEYTRRLAVDSMAGGAVGYVHLRAMTAGNIAEWYREFYPVFNRQGLIVDVRHNSGGNIESWILEKLMREAWMYWQPRVGDPYWNMQYAFRGHVVVLQDERTASDGEAFAEGFRRLGLGKVIGTRSWGGEIWLSQNNTLVDRGIVTAAETGVYGAEGTWLIEGHGVDPDIEVDNLPHATFRGEDAQLAAAVAHLRQLIAADPRPVPKAPAYPDKSSADNRRLRADGGSGRP